MEYHKINNEYSIFELKSCDGHFKTLIDTRFVEDLKRFNWKIPKSKDPNRKGIYFMTSISSKLKNEYQSILKKNHLIFMHEFIAYLSCIDKPVIDEQITVDHINRETLDNREENLRWATILQQNRNRNRKRERTLPPNYIPELPMYVTWNSGYEIAKPSGNKLLREFFRIENHPALPFNNNNNRVIWSSTKHTEVSIIDKFNQAIQKLNKLNEISPPDNSINELRLKNVETYQRLMNILPVIKICEEQPPELTSFVRDNIIIEVLPDHSDYILIKHNNGTKAITNKRLFGYLKQFSIYPENGVFRVSVLKKHKEIFNIQSNSKSPLHTIILHLDGNFCKNDNKKERFVCQRNSIHGDYRIENLYWGSKTEQQFCKETKPIINYDTLPEDFKDQISIGDIPKYVYYHREEKENKARKDYFFIKHHPYQEKGMITSTTSFKVSHIDKYNEVLEKLQLLNLKVQVDEDTPEFVKVILVS